jgi:hypothetical protein
VATLGGRILKINLSSSFAHIVVINRQTTPMEIFFSGL